MKRKIQVEQSKNMTGRAREKDSAAPAKGGKGGKSVYHGAQITRMSPLGFSKHADSPGYLGHLSTLNRVGLSGAT